MTASPSALERPKQNWIVDPVSDVIFIIAAPILAFVWALLTLQTLGAEMVWSIFIIFNVAHHFPTFIRIYGDKDCFNRFRWSLLLGPLIPFTIGLCLTFYTLKNGYPMQTLYLMMMLLTIWDPWHFLMQHYGFMRIYDRHNKAPRQIASWMDYMISLVWFAFIMLATGEWLFENVLHRLFTDSGFPLLLWIDPSVYQGVLTTAFALAAVCSLIYLGYTVWCFRKGYFVSPAKISLLIVTFGMMYITYVPTSFLRNQFPSWTFSVGFATLGMMHVTQYLAIVWKFNRSLAKRGEERSRPGIFSHVFARGGFTFAVGYVAICLIYGTIVGSEPAVKQQPGVGVDINAISILSCLIVCVGFTSTTMHYYYDGFIWKLRHKENSENLEDTGEVAEKVAGSWWERIGTKSLLSKFNANSVGATLVRQFCYFGVPLLLLVTLFFYIGQSPREAGHLSANTDGLLQAWDIYRNDPTTENLKIAQNIVRKMDRQIAAEERMVELNTARRVGHEVELAYLTFYRAWGRINLLIKPEQEPTTTDLAEFRSEAEKAISMLEKHFDPSVEPYGPMQEEMLFQWQQWNSQLAELSG